MEENINLGYLIINDANDIDFKLMLDDYRENFAGRIVKITTNYNILSEFYISFNEKDLPHLLGLQKLRTTRYSSSQIIKQIDSGKFTKKTVMKKENWKNVRKRSLNYNFLHRIFIDQDIDFFVETRDMKPNRLKLDVVFMYNKKRESVILGLRKDKDSKYFKLTTLHTESKNNQYNNRRRTHITGVEFIK